MNCGPDSLQYCLRRDGKKAIKADLIKALKVHQDNGAWSLSMARVLEDKGYKAWIESEMTWERVQHLLDSRCWVILSWWTIFFPEGETRDWGGAHWSVITKVSDTKVWLWDPSYGTIVAYPRATIDANWLSPERVGRIVHDEVRVAVVAERPVKPKPVSKTKKTTKKGQKGRAKPSKSRKSVYTRRR